MTNPLYRNVSFFPRVTTPDNPTNGAFLQVVTSLKLVAKYGSLIEQIRRTRDKEKRATLKINLPCFTPSGTFSHRSEKDLLVHSGLLQFDIDPKENPTLNAETAATWKEQISHLQQIAYCALSASGAGVWGVVVIANPAHHQAHFEALKADFAGWGIVLDEKCGSVAHPRYWSYDPEAYFNPQAVIYAKEKKPHQNNYAPRQKMQQSGTNNTKVEAILAQIDAAGKNITDGYAAWFSIGCALANEFGENGRDYFHRASQYHPAYHNEETDKQFSSCLRMGASRITLGSFFEIARRHGLEYKADLSGPSVNVIADAPPPIPCLSNLTVLPPGFRQERLQDRNSGQYFEVLLNPSGYPATWNLPDAQAAGLAQLIRKTPEITQLIGRFDLQLEGVEKLTEESERAWEKSKARAKKIRNG